MIVVLFILILTSAFASGSETALFSLSPLKIKNFRQKGGDRQKIVVQLLERPKDLLVTILIINIGVNILVQNVVSEIFGVFSGWLLTVGVPLVLTLVFGEVIPKSIAMANNEKMSLIGANPIYFLRWLFTPIRFFFTKTAGTLSRFIFFFLKSEKDISIDELVHALKTSRDYGIISSDEAKLIRGSLNLDGLLVKELMRPRIEILYFDIQEPIHDLLNLFIDQECSRIPVVDEDLDNILGVITSAQFFLHQSKIKTGEDLKRFVKECYFVPETMGAKDLFVQFRERKESIALVIDEYGSICGVISMEDIVEVVVGQIEDKRDEEMLFTKASEDVIIASGKMELAELEEVFDISLRHKTNMTTVGGFLTEQIGDIPQSGAKYTIDNILFNVLASSKTKVLKVYIRKLK
ncbi:MAG: HlyC/CorC family transporter [Chlamydiae bacterium]|nr:HlyC/CorC family transporter [Chlamydiota bacterium]